MRGSVDAIFDTMSLCHERRRVCLREQAAQAVFYKWKAPINKWKDQWVCSLLLAYCFEVFRHTSYVNMWVMGMMSQFGEPVST